ncbi:zinc ribbon domain-containing protein [Clostridium perfringens]|nr:zinc ribbon domain-containing protein [Clostridium perfringens]MDM0464988.1 zinc ribbon domain-containing protein [Clostridium perfringens]
MIVVLFILALIFTFLVPPLGIILWIVFTISLIFKIFKGSVKGVGKVGKGIYKVSTEYRCPYCKSIIKRGAIICPQCGERLEESKQDIKTFINDEVECDYDNLEISAEKIYNKMLYENSQKIRDYKIKINKLKFDRMVYKLFCIDKLIKKERKSNKFFEYLKKNEFIFTIIFVVMSILFLYTSIYNVKTVKNGISKIVTEKCSVDGLVITNNSNYYIRNLTYVENEGYRNEKHYCITKKLAPGESYTVDIDGYNYKPKISIDTDQSSNTELTRNTYYYIVILIIMLILYLIKLIYIDDFKEIDLLNNKIKELDKFNNSNNLEENIKKIKLELMKDQIIKEEKRKQEKLELERIKEEEKKKINLEINEKKEREELLRKKALEELKLEGKID